MSHDARGVTAALKLLPVPRDAAFDDLLDRLEAACPDEPKGETSVREERGNDER